MLYHNVYQRTALHGHFEHLTGFKYIFIFISVYCEPICIYPTVLQVQCVATLP